MSAPFAFSARLVLFSDGSGSSSLDRKDGSTSERVPLSNWP